MHIYSALNISDSNFSHNIATEGGAAVAMNGSLVMSNCLVFNNSANGDGGAVMFKKAAKLQLQLQFSR